MVPILSEVSATLKDKIQVVKIDTEKYPSIANKYKIEALPTFILFKDGEPCDRFVCSSFHVFLIFLVLLLRFLLNTHKCFFFSFQEGALAAKQLIQRIENSLEVKP